MKGHSWFITQFVFPLTMLLVCFPVACAARWCGLITPKERSCPWWKFAVLALMGGVGNFVNAWPQSELPGSLLTVLGQLGTPILMVLSVILLSARYKWQHYAGTCLISTLQCSCRRKALP